jgi:hypothetical protein
MNDHESIDPVGQSQAEPRKRARAQAKITVQSSEIQCLRPKREPGIDGDPSNRNVHRRQVNWESSRITGLR